MAANLSVRRAGPDDAATLAELRWNLRTELRTPGEARDAFVERCRAWYAVALESPDWLFWLAEGDGAPVASVSLYLVPKIPNPVGAAERLGYVTSFFVAPGERNSGIGTSLLRLVVAEARRLELECLILWPSARSVPFYRRHGFSTPTDLLEMRLDDPGEGRTSARHPTD